MDATKNSCDRVNASSGADIALRSGIDRRTLLALGGIGAAGLVAAPFVYRALHPTAPAFVARNQRYDGPLAVTIRDGLTACGFDPATVRGKQVLLKPNLVEPSCDRPHMTTHPAVVVAAAEIFRGWGATVTVGEAPGHVRDTEMALFESGLGEALADAGILMKDMVSAVSAGRIEDAIVLDLDYNEDSHEDGVDIPIAMVHHSKEISLLQMDGIIKKDDFMSAVELAKKACNEIYDVQKAALKKKFDVQPEE